MISKSAASFLFLLSFLTVSLPFAAGQRAPHLPGDRPALPGGLPFSLPIQTGQGGMPHRGPSTPAELARAASQADVSLSQFQAALSSPSTGPIFFAAPTYGSGGQYAYSVVVGDMNGDGKPDLVVANRCDATGNCANGSVSVLLGNGDGTFQAAVSYGSGGQDATSLVVGDVNVDGKLDLVVANRCADHTCANGSVSVLLGNGDGTFQAAVSYGSGGQNAYSVAVGDVSGDSKPDLVVANEGS